ncbi:YdgA family protein [Rhizobium leguminosarum]|uniref:YdgA family protein n=1 Tax=Rhizobium leguminosarum TaxID=384 RepID=UPI001C956E03|nr:YdgA family protein [Rhizobium leguminosarum]MBY5369241.1 YdgA family protein [Rhizobium leguminosarum]MBY5450777.1 YdgA family protein [Rhizobium leguminosarum]
MNFYRRTRLMLSGAAFFSLAGSAFALDSADLLKKINAAYAAQGGTISADGVDIDGTTVTLKNVSVKPANGESLPIGEVTLSGVEEDEDGGYYIEEAAFPDINKTEDGVTVTAEGLTLGGISVPATAGGDTLDTMMLYETAHTGPLKVVKDGEEMFSLLESDVNLTLREDESGFDFDGAFKSMKADLSKAEDPQSKDAIEKLALQHIQGDITMKGAWELAPGTIDISELAFDFTNIGKLNLGFKISGYTMAFMKSMQDAMKQSEASANKEQSQQALGLAMLGLMQQLSFEAAQVRFEDASITKRALDYAGSQQNISGKQMADSLKAMTPIMLAQLNIPELQNAVSAAVNTFLDDPKSLTVKAAPEKPVPFPTIVGAAMGAPNTLPQVLGVKVTAND